MIRNIKLTIAYDGSKFNGFQSQKDKNSVQECLEDAIEKLTGKRSRIVSAGRTDAGVHAYGQVVNFLTSSNIRADVFKFHLRKYLPNSISIVMSEEVDLDFHARFSAKSKTYRYVIRNSRFIHPIHQDYRAHVPYEMNIELLKAASKKLLGRHDFKAFMKQGDDRSTIRKIDDIKIFTWNDDIILEFTAESFLHNQIRIMVGCLIDVARGHRSLDYIDELFESGDREKAGITYPAAGLYLMRVKY